MFTRLFVASFVVSGLLAAAQSNPSSQSAAGSETSSNLPAQPIGPDDLVSITVYEAPELSRTVRISSDGALRLPMVKERLAAQGRMPSDLELDIAKALKAEGLLVDPVVSVAVMEYRSRPISIAGEVRSPTSFQAMPGTTLLDAITRAGGLTDEAGADVLVTSFHKDDTGKSTSTTARVSAKLLLEEADSIVNLPLHGGEQIRVPSAGRIYVVGNVRQPGAVKVRDNSDATVFKVISMTQGLNPFSTKLAYVYRKEAGQAGKDGIPIELSKIMHRESPDVALLPNDILYIPENTAKKTTVEALERMLGYGAAYASLGLAVTR